jgi:signal transduction histidine kinase
MSGLWIESADVMAATTIEHDASSKALEPGLHRILRVLAAAQVLSIPLFRRAVAAGMGIEVPLLPSLLVTMPVPLLLLALVWVPAFERRLGRFLLPLVVVLASANLLADKFVTLAWLVPPAQRDLNGILLLVRLWVFFHCLTLLVAWQYPWQVAALSAFVLCAADAALSLTLTRADSPLHPLLLVLIVVRTVTVTGVAMGVGWLLQHQREQKSRLAAANRKLAHYAATSQQLAISQERNRLARELHDTLAHSLTAVIVQLEAIQALWAVNAQSARAMLDSALQTARSGVTEARRALKALRASPLEEAGLSVAIGNLARSTALRGHLDLTLDTPPDGTTCRADQEQFLYRVAQEAMSNVVRHANATELRVMLERTNGEVTLTVADNGVGLGKAAVDPSAHFGLKGIQERVDIMGGCLIVESRPGLGTTLRVTVPVDGES